MRQGLAEEPLHAAAEFEKAIALDPGNGWAYCQLGKIYRGQGRWAEAEAALRQALKLDARNGWARIELGVLYQGQDRLPEAAAEFEEVIALGRDQGWAHCQLGRIYHKQGRASEAEAALRKALEFYPRDGGAHMELGALYHEQDRFPEAAAEFERAIAMDPKNGRAHGLLGRIYYRQRRRPESEAAFKKALAIAPQLDWACVDLGVLYKDQGRLAEAEAAFQRAIACGPRNGGAHLELGNVYRRQGRWGEAEAEFKAAIAIEPENDRAYMGLWAVCRSQGRTAEAAGASRQALAINPGNSWACIGSRDRLDRDAAAGGNSKGQRRGRVFCLLPWTHLHIPTDGSSRPCCAWGGPPLGNVRSSSLAELWNSPGLKALRVDMMSGQPAAGCERCYEDERSGFVSMRQRKNIELDRHRGRERLTAADGTLPRLSVPWLDLRLSNVCNLRCRTCDAIASSAWMADARALGLSAEGGPLQKSYDDWDSLWRQLQPVLEEGVEEIRFAGGEPLVMEEHYRILDFLIARKLTDVRLTYHTNFSTLRFQGRDAIGLWSRFRHVKVAASLDASGRRGEYLRKGICWDTVVANREEMLRRSPETSFVVLPTISIFNALHLPDFHREWVEKGYIDRDAFLLNRLETPGRYCMQVLPPALKARVAEAYRRYQESFLDADDVVARDFAAAARFMEAQDHSGLLPEFVAMTRRLDALRGEDCREVFPELAELFEAAA